MATQKTELFDSYDGLPPSLRVEPRTIQPRIFGTGSGTLAKLTAVAMVTATGKWVPWDQSAATGAQIIRGFVWPDAVVLDGSDDVIGNILLEGKVHYDDLVNPDAGATTTAQWKAALREIHTFGLMVEGIGV
jgi:hypothetical protein